MDDENNPCKKQTEAKVCEVDQAHESSENVPSTPTPVIVVFNNTMGDHFELEQVRFVLDKRIVYSDTSGALHRQRRSTVYNGLVPSGKRQIEIVLRFQGKGSGSLSYLNGYRFQVHSGHVFEVRPESGVRLDVYAWERGSEERPSVCYVQQTWSGER